MKMRYATHKLLMALLLSQLAARALPPGAGPLLFTDRSWALSGDTVGFMVAGAGKGPSEGNVVHVRLLAPSGRTTCQVMLRTEEGAGRGYLAIPDSLSSGVYRLHAYAGKPGDQRGDGTLARLLTVYHRFDGEVNALPLPEGLAHTGIQLPAEEIIRTNGEVFSTREEVTFTLQLPVGFRMKEAVVSASLGETPATAAGDFAILPQKEAAASPDPLPAEVNGFFVEGRVVAPEGRKLPHRSLVLLSIPGEIPWFDYCFAGEEGFFRFLLKNTYGTAGVYIRAIAGGDDRLSVRLITGRETGSEDKVDTLPLSGEATRFVKEMTEAGWYGKRFAFSQVPPAPRLEISNRNPLPFYGLPDQRIIPAELTDLPDFREITRELLPAVRFRHKNGHYELRIIDDQERKFFEKSPLRLVNGIPVFDDNRLFGLKSTDIRHIDLVYRERIFGDISFKGVVAIRLKEEAENWILGETTLHHFSLSCLQMPSAPGYSLFPCDGQPRHLPDLRQVFLFRTISPEEPSTFTFCLSDLKGPVIIKLEGITGEGNPFQTSRTIMVR